MELGHNSYRNARLGIERALRRNPKNPMLAIALEQVGHYADFWHDQIIGMAGGHTLDNIEPKYITNGTTLGDYLTRS